MFTFFEAYMPECWDGLVKRGFIRPGTGLRFCQNKMLEDDQKFNILAAEGSAFHQLVKEMNCPMYIDRLQGGCYIDEYPYDRKLLSHYRQMLGDQFYGFQMHEWMSNLFTDFGKIRRGNIAEWTEKQIEATIREQYPVKHLFLEAMTAGEFAEAGNVASSDAFYTLACRLYEKRLAEVGALVPCDSYALAYKLELERGARFVMPEVGAQTPDSRLQIAYAQSISRSYGAGFGVYYEPWGGSPFSACCYHRQARNEWNIGQPGDFPFQTQGENGGSSRSLQLRIFLYGYLSGAAFISEEWGMCNTFYDWEDFAVSPYGMTKLEFRRFTEEFPHVGEKMTPIAAVLPKQLDVVSGIHSSGEFCGYPLDEARNAVLDKSKDGLRKLFSHASSMLGTETHSLINSPIPDAIALIHADAPDLNRYDYLIDLTGDSAFAASHNNIIAVDEAEKMLEKLLPCRLEGNLHWMVNQKSDGGYYLIAFNHSGVVRTVAEGESILPEAKTTVRIHLKDNRALTVLAGNADLSQENDTWFLTVPGGGWFFGEF